MELEINLVTFKSNYQDILNLFIKLRKLILYNIYFYH